MEPLQMVGEATKLGLPFMLTAGASERINKTRLVESVIIAAVSGAMISLAGYYVAFPVLQKQVEHIAQRQQEQYIHLIGILNEYKREREQITAKRDAQYYAQEAKIVALQIELAKEARRR
jgi:hypothetical protein